jgi:hypothetical protein
VANPAACAIAAAAGPLLLSAAVAAGTILALDHVLSSGSPAARWLDIQRKKWDDSGDDLTEEDAIDVVRRGGDVIARDKDRAKRIAERAGNGSPIWHRRHGGHEKDHFHPRGPNGEKLPGHVAY